MRIFIHSVLFKELDPSYISTTLHAEKRLLDYSQRAVLLASKNDYVILNRPLDSNYRDYLSELGLGAEQHIVPEVLEGSLIERTLADDKLITSLQRLCLNKSAIISPYLSGAAERDFADRVGATLLAPNEALTKVVNSKVWFRNELIRLNLPTTEGVVATRLTVFDCVAHRYKEQGQVVVRGDKSCGGSSVWAIKDDVSWRAFEQAVSHHGINSLYLVEKMYAVQLSPNVQFEIGIDAIYDFGLTEQIIAPDLSHRGNVYPVTSSCVTEVMQMSREISVSLKRAGYLGLIGIDFIVLDDGQVIPIEINARTNTSTFGLAVIERVFGRKKMKKHFKIFNKVKFLEAFSFNHLKELLESKKSLLFTLEKGHGVFPYNVGCLDWGECDLMVIGDSWDHLERLERELNSRFSLAA